MAARQENDAAPKKSGYAYLVSACLAGVNCTHNGKNKLNLGVRRMVEDGMALSVCPEVLGGSSVPRESCEIFHGDGSDVLAGRSSVRTISGRDVTGKLVLGARRTLALAKRYGIKKAVLKSKSPSCGNISIYDGTFTRSIKKGAGVTATLLKAHRISVYNEKELGHGKQSILRKSSS